MKIIRKMFGQDKENQMKELKGNQGMIKRLSNNDRDSSPALAQLKSFLCKHHWFYILLHTSVETFPLIHI